MYPVKHPTVYEQECLVELSHQIKSSGFGDRIEGIDLEGAYPTTSIIVTYGVGGSGGPLLDEKSRS